MEYKLSSHPKVEPILHAALESSLSRRILHGVGPATGGHADDPSRRSTSPYLLQ